MKSPYPWFGGKSTMAGTIWRALGDVPNYVEPFMGSNAILLSRPGYDPARHREIVNDADGFVSNFWRALQSAPDEVARWCDYPSLENDLHARQAWLVQRIRGLAERLEGDPDYYDAKIAGRWVWGLANSVGSSWCRQGSGPWAAIDGRFIRVGPGAGISRSIIHTDSERGVKRKSLQRLTPDGQPALYAYMRALAKRMRHVIVASGDWTRVVTPFCCVGLVPGGELTGVVLDPPYAPSERDAVYRVDGNISNAVREWAIAHGDNPSMRIVLCGYEGEHSMPTNWRVYRYKVNGGYTNTSRRSTRAKINRERETLWFSPHCLPVDASRTLF